MSCSRIISAICIYCCSIPQAYAHDTCDYLDRFFNSLATVHEIQSDPAQKLTPERARILEDSLAHSPDKPHHHTPDKELYPEEHGAMLSYIAQVSTAVSSYQNGSIEFSEELISSAITSDLGVGLATLQKSHGCLTAAGLAASRATRSSPAPAEKDKAQTASNSGQSSHASANVEKSKVSASPSAGSRTQSAQSGPRLDMKTGNTSWVIFSLLAAIGAFYAVHRRDRKLQERAERFACDYNVRVVIGEDSAVMKIIDFTKDGMRLKHNGDFDNPKNLNLFLMGQWHSGKVVWQNAFFLGVKLAHPLSQAQIDMLAQTVEDEEPAKVA